ncbi:hypothetical protein [Kitasatospora sp. NPDC050543]|uniref:hypothetical protein n=1 Tax=Kitasatospora sp. NPDC050543 TaxID=3364054 RepID=UPI0037AC4A55
MTEDQGARSRPGEGTPGRSGAPGEPGEPGDELLSSEEWVVRELMRRAVADVQPDPAALAHIRRSVPRRRAVRRGAWTGAAAAALATVGLLPAVLPVLHDGDHLGLSGRPGSVGTAGGAPGEQSAVSAVTGGTSQGRPASPRPSGTGADASGTAASPGPETAPTPRTPSAASGSASTAGGGVTAGSTAPDSVTGTAAGPVPRCDSNDLGQGSAYVGAADGQGAVYGYFSVINVSGRSCALGGPGAVLVSATTGTAARDRVRIVDHTAGDPAVGLPDPARATAAGTASGLGTAESVLVLPPQGGYRVQFGWLPDGGSCQSPPVTSPASASPSASTGPSGSGTAGPGPSTRASAAPRAGEAAPEAPPSAATGSGGEGATGSPGPAALTSPSPSAGTPGPSSQSQPSVTLTHTAAPGGPTATAVLTGACSGTVYRTAPQPDPTHPAAPPATG